MRPKQKENTGRFGIVPFVGLNNGLLRQVLLENENSQESSLSRGLNRFPQRFPASALKKSITGNHTIALQLHSGGFAFGSDLPTTAAQSIESNIAKRGIKRRLIKQVEFICTEGAAKAKPGRRLRKSAFKCGGS